jgi:hypothetical protein
MKPWSERPIEIAHLFNPAFCGLLIKEGVSGFFEERAEGLPFPIAFLLLPIVLHKTTRDALPQRLSTRMHPWIQENQEARVGFPRRCSSMAGHTREAVLFALASDLVTLSQDGKLNPSLRRSPTIRWPRDSESVGCIRKARFAGRWMGNAGEVATVFAMWGVRP